MRKKWKDFGVGMKSGMWLKLSVFLLILVIYSTASFYPVFAGTIPGSGEITVGGPQCQLTISSVPSQIDLGESFTVYCSMENIGESADNDFVGSIFICFPTLTHSNYEDQASIIVYSDIETSLKKAGDAITHRSGSQIPAQYLEVRADKVSWTQGESHYLRIDVTPKLSGSFPIYLRGGFIQISTNMYVSNDPTSSSVTDHRGWPVDSKTVNVVLSVTELEISESFKVSVSQGGSDKGSIKIYNPDNIAHSILQHSFQITDYKGFTGNIYTINLDSNLNVPSKGFAIIQVKVEPSVDCPRGTYYPEYTIQSDV